MPILVKDFRWKDSEGKVHLSVPLNGVHHKHLNIFHTDKYLRLSFPPYHCELFLPQEIRISYPNPDSIDGKHIQYQ